jgi:hypothetical protein
LDLLKIYESYESTSWRGIAHFNLKLFSGSAHILKHIDNFNAAPGQELSWITATEELDLICSDINSNDLSIMLKYTSNLKTLHLSNCQNLNPLPETLNTLDNLKLLDVKMTNSPGMLIAIAPHAEVNIDNLSISTLYAFVG